jgi:uncharacterized Ntn-hydrolase superfamily protein
MTFTTLARCPRTGMLGIATATSSYAVGVRVPHVRPLLGAVAIMARADQRLGHTAMNPLTRTTSTDSSASSMTTAWRRPAPAR